MAVTYYVALPFIRTDDGTAPGACTLECDRPRIGRIA